MGAMASKWVLCQNSSGEWVWIAAYQTQSTDTFSTLCLDFYGTTAQDAITGLATFNAEITESTGLPTAAGSCANACSGNPTLYAGEWLYLPGVVGDWQNGESYSFNCGAVEPFAPQDCTVQLWISGACGCACDGCWMIDSPCNMGTGSPC